MLKNKCPGDTWPSECDTNTAKRSAIVGEEDCGSRESVRRARLERGYSGQ